MAGTDALDPARIEGAWTLDAFVVHRADGRTVHPYGEAAQGSLLYVDGRVSAVLSKAPRGDFTAATLERVHRAPAEDKARAFDGYTSYAGTYAIDGDLVRHHVEMSLVPTLVGTTLERRAAFDGPQLVLRYEVEGRAGTHRYELRWSRARNGT